MTSRHDHRVLPGSIGAAGLAAAAVLLLGGVVIAGVIPTTGQATRAPSVVSSTDDTARLLNSGESSRSAGVEVARLVSVAPSTDDMPTDDMGTDDTPRLLSIGESGPPATDEVAWTASVSSPTDDTRRLLPIVESSLPATVVLRFDTATRRQSWSGVGGALTDATVTLLAERPDVQRLLFDPADPAGAHLNLLRLPLSATDFSTEWWTWNWDEERRVASPSQEAIAATEMVVEFATFQPDLSVVATPWSAPATMKTSERVDGGALMGGSETSYADLLVAQIEWLDAQGVPIDALTVGNEPGHASDYPTMTMTNEQLAKVGERVAAQIAPDVELWMVDHNWSDRPRYDVLAAPEPTVWSRAAFHCYLGQPADMASLPVSPIVTECTGTDGGWAETFAWDAELLVAEAIDAGSTGLMMWNLALDPDHGPKRPGGCETCRGLLTVDPSTGAVDAGPEFYTLAHLARAADPGAVSIAGQRVPEVPAVAFSNPDGTIGVFGHNDSGVPQVIAVDIDGLVHRFHVGPGELFTLRERA